MDPMCCLTKGAGDAAGVRGQRALEGADRALEGLERLVTQENAGRRDLGVWAYGVQCGWF
jgi:hypothetical protein